MKPALILAAYCSCGLITAPLANVSAQEKQATVKLEMLKDRRNKGIFHSLELSLRVEGGDTPGAVYARAVAKSATDSTGQDLLAAPNPQEILKKPEFKAKRGTKSALVDMELSNPVRQATHLREVSGVVQMFFPQRDEQSIVTIDNIHRSAGRPAESPILKASDLGITFFTKAQQAASGAEKRRVDEDEIEVRIQDPAHKLVDIVFEDEAGKKLEWQSRSFGAPTQTITFENAIPTTVRARIYVTTPKSLVEIPFHFSDLRLP